MTKTKKETRGRKAIYTPEEARKRRMAIIADNHKRTMTAFCFRFHNENDKEIIDKINSVDNKCDYIRQLIMKDIGIDEQ